MQKSSTLYQAFFTSIIKGKIEDIIETAYQYLKHPITVIDASYKLLGQIPMRPVQDVVFDALLKNGEMPQETVWMLEESRYRSYLHENPQPSYVSWGNLNFPRIMGTFKSGNSITGYYAVLFKDGDYSEEYLKICEIFSQSLSFILQKQNCLILHRNELGYVFMRELINGNLRKQGAISLWGRYCPAILQGAYQIIIAKNSHERSDREYSVSSPVTVPGGNLEYICRNLEERKRNCFIAENGEMIYILFYSLGKTIREIERKQNEINETMNFLFSFEMWCGKSKVFENINEINTAKFTAEDALNTGIRIKGEGRVYSFEDMVFTCMMEKITKIPEASVYIHPALKVLSEYDKTYNTGFLNTLNVFILSFKDLTNTAKRLKIHRNTLKYRLQKITELCNIDLTNHVLCSQLLCNFYMMADAPVCIS
jgi:sugar diacid utilization regulator